MIELFRNLISLFRQPSTYAGCATLAMTLGAPEAAVDTTVQTLAAISSLAAIFISENND